MGSVPELYKKTSFFIVLTHPLHFFSILQSSTVLVSVLKLTPIFTSFLPSASKGTM